MGLNLVSQGRWSYWRHGSGDLDSAPPTKPTKGSRNHSTAGRALIPIAVLEYNRGTNHQPPKNKEPSHGTRQEQSQPQDRLK